MPIDSTLSPPRAVVLRPFFMQGVYIPLGSVIRLRCSVAEYWALVRTGWIRVIETHDVFYHHVATDRLFASAAAYRAWDQAWMQSREALAPRPVAGEAEGGAPETPQEPVPQTLVRPQSNTWQTWTRQETLAVLVEAARKIHQHRRLTWAEILKRMRPKVHRNTLTSIHTTHRITLEEIATYR